MNNIIKNFLFSMNMATWSAQGSSKNRLSNWSENI